jgi:hypothetical protein
MMAGLASRRASACAINCACPKVLPQAPWRDYDPLGGGAVGRGSDDFVRMQGAATGSRLIASPSFPLSVVTGCLRAGSDAVDVAAVTSATNKNPTSTACAQKHILQEESWIHSGTTGSMGSRLRPPDIAGIND